MQVIMSRRWTINILSVDMDLEEAVAGVSETYRMSGTSAIELRLDKRWGRPTRAVIFMQPGMSPILDVGIVHCGLET